ncbi:MAG: glycosyltransferase [Candidatus Sericytochromatia bacterium]
MDPISVLGWALSAIWLGIGYRLFQTGFELEQAAQSYPEPDLWPRVSIVVPARNEAHAISNCLEKLLAQDYPNLEIIAVNDRSEDATASLMETWAAQDSRLKVVTIIDKPADWLGKTHALWQGVNVASGDWLLFMDGDIFLAPDCLKLAVRFAEGRKVDQLSLFPDFIPGGYWENLFICHFGIMFFSVYDLAGLENPRRKHSYTGIGAFGLFKRESYLACGGHQTLALEVIDDVQLGRLLKNEGFKISALFARQRVQLRWHQGVKGLFKGLEKNAFAGIRYSWSLLCLFTAVVGVFFILPYFAIFLWPGLRSSGFAMSLLLFHGLYFCKGQEFCKNPWIGLAAPLGALLNLVTFWHSAVKTLWQKGIYWREDFYPLQALKAKMYRGQPLTKPRESPILKANSDR